jgi:hypothetical protein
MSLRRIRRIATVTVLPTALGLTACGDPPPAPNVAPIEIVLDGCVLNRESVAAGTHEIAVVGSGEATVTGPGGAATFTLTGGMPEPRSIEMSTGSWTVTCTVASGSGEAGLTVTP